jgi:hypothetical protein
MTGASDPSDDWPGLIARFDRPEALALVLVGSQARDAAGPFSDVDLVRFVPADAPPLPGSGSHLVDGRLVVVSDAPPAEVGAWFVRPELALGRIPGLREGRPLRGRDGFFAALRARARAFAWDAAMQARADAFANEAMVGWVEEVHKGLAGLRAADAGRLLDATYGLSWGLNRLVEVQKGVPLAGDVAWSPDWFERAEQVVGPRSAWARLRRRAFGVATDAPPTLRERVVAGLRLHVATAELLADVWTPPGDELIAYAVRLVRGALADEPGA